MGQEKDTRRGRLFVQFLQQYISELSSKSALDVGCRYGAFTFEMAKAFRKVVGIEIDASTREATRRKAAKHANIEILDENILATSFKDESFDVIALEGVLEWVGNSNPEMPAIECQRRALAECRRLLKPGGLLYVGIENRLCPPFWLKDPHGRLPLTVILPRAIAKPLYKLFRGSYYGQNILSYWGYKRLFKQFFGETEILIPIPHYKYLYEVSSPNGRELRDKIRKTKPKVHAYQAALTGLQMASYVDITRIVAPNFAILARKKAGKK